MSREDKAAKKRQDEWLGNLRQAAEICSLGGTTSGKHNGITTLL